MQRLFDYLDDVGSMPLLGAIAAPPVEFGSLSKVFKQTREHERLVAAKINELARFSRTVPVPARAGQTIA